MVANDHWSAQKYSAAASFVPQLTSKVISYLSPQPSDRILDLGCGDGQLTAQIARSAHSVLGLDASPSFISSAKQTHTTKKCTFQLQDVTKLNDCAGLLDGSWDKVFSNAALHWILRDPATREDVFRNAFRALEGGGQGRLVFEMGGHGNVAEVQAALLGALVHQGPLSIEAAREASPWFFPSPTYMERLLKGVGFEVETCELEYRPTKLNAENEDGSGGLEGWVRLMGAQFLEAVDGEEKREAVVKEVCEVLKTVLERVEDGSMWIGYVRLRVVARKP